MYDDEMSREDKKMYHSAEYKHRAENDVHTMIQYKKIHDDPERYKMAMHCAKKKSKDFEEISKPNPGKHYK